MPQDATTVRTIATRAIAGAALVFGSLFILVAPTGVAFADDGAIAVMVNGEPITAVDVAQRLKFDQLATHSERSRREVVDELIDEKLKLQAARQRGIDVTDPDVDAAYAAMAKRMKLTPEELTGALAGRGVDAGTLKQRIRADIAWVKVGRGSANIPSLRDPPPPRKKDDGPSWRE